MSKAIVIGLLLVHGAIHLLGLVKGLGWAEVPQLSHAISRPWAIVWGLCAALLIAAAGGRLGGAGWWWMPAAPGLVLSQIAIVAFWSDAKVGTVANLLLLVPVVVGFGSWRFAGAVDRDLARLAGQAAADERPLISEADLVELPPPVATWLRSAGVVGRSRPRSLYLTQHGQLQTSKDGDWMEFRAEQWFAVPDPGFVWTVEVDAGRLLFMAGRDRYLGGSGSMRIELLSVVPVVDASGPTIDQGALVRFLAETIWFPGAALEPYIQWQATGDRSARAVMRHGDVEVSGLFRFDGAGNVIGFEARRYRDELLEDWIIENDPEAIELRDGVRIPTRSTITWRDADGERWTWLKIAIDEVDREATLP